MISKRASIKLKYDLNNLPHVVVQASEVSPEQVYVLQLLHDQHDTVIFRHPAYGQEINFEDEEPVLYLKGKNGKQAGGHTQTWIFSGRDKRYFIGVKPKKFGHTMWDTEIARVILSEVGGDVYSSHSQFPRLSEINLANNANKLVRVEAAVSPDYQLFFLGSIDADHTAHFAIYNLNEVNRALDIVEGQPRAIKISELNCLDKFSVPHFNDRILRSVQGYGIDENKNIYISSQLSPTQNVFGFAKQRLPRQIIKIPWGEKNSENWQVIRLDKTKEINLRGFVTEFEGIQVIGENKVYLTIAYHKKYRATTLHNKIFELNIEK